MSLGTAWVTYEFGASLIFKKKKKKKKTLKKKPKNKNTHKKINE